VEITGEVYFEVAKNPAKPFRVTVAEAAEIEVLGTHFNVNSYPDEPSLNTTLLEGSVKVRATGIPGNVRLLKPGHQAQLGKNGSFTLDPHPDIEAVMAWKNGKFQFGDATDIATAMRQIARWYDVDIEIAGNIEDHIGGSLSRARNAELSKILNMIEMTGARVHFEIKGRKVIVRPGKK
jgi:ferric-dicitrate binding protein FerR (iron transport regulator)